MMFTGNCFSLEVLMLGIRAKDIKTEKIINTPLSSSLDE